MNKFQSVQELRLEKQKLYLKKEMLENEIKLDFEEFRESLKPINMIKDLLHPKAEKGPEKSMSPVALSIGGTALDLILGKLLFRKSSIVKKFISSMVVRAVGPSLITKAAPIVSVLIKGLYDKFLHKNNSKQHYEQSTASDQY